MTEQPVAKRTCRYCGKETPVAANFCWYCARELEARPEHPMEDPPRAGATWIWVIAIALVALVLILVVIRL